MAVMPASLSRLASRAARACPASDSGTSCGGAIAAPANSACRTRITACWASATPAPVASSHASMQITPPVLMGLLLLTVGCRYMDTTPAPPRAGTRCETACSHLACRQGRLYRTAEEVEHEAWSGDTHHAPHACLYPHTALHYSRWCG